LAGTVDLAVLFLMADSRISIRCPLPPLSRHA